MALSHRKSSSQHRASTPARTDRHDSLATPDGTVIPVWQPGAEDPIAHLASVFDQLPGRPRDSRP